MLLIIAMHSSGSFNDFSIRFVALETEELARLPTMGMVRFLSAATRLDLVDEVVVSLCFFSMSILEKHQAPCFFWSYNFPWFLFFCICETVWNLHFESGFSEAGVDVREMICRSPCSQARPSDTQNLCFRPGFWQKLHLTDLYHKMMWSGAVLTAICCNQIFTSLNTVSQVAPKGSQFLVFGLPNSWDEPWPAQVSIITSLLSSGIVTWLMSDSGMSTSTLMFRCCQICSWDTSWVGPFEAQIQLIQRTALPPWPRPRLPRRSCGRASCRSETWRPWRLAKMGGACFTLLVATR